LHVVIHTVGESFDEDGKAKLSSTQSSSKFFIFSANDNQLKLQRGLIQAIRYFQNFF
jgi:hypothetical protein